MAEKTNGDYNAGNDGLSVEETALLATGGPLGKIIRAAAHEAGKEQSLISEGDEKKVLELHVCAGINACIGHGLDGDKNRYAGTGDCATVQHWCHGDNECRGQGGCGYAGNEYEQSIPGEQACRWNGSCASPINECRVASAGPFKGTGVWKLARKRFEQRMWQAGRPFGVSPLEGYPDDLVPSYESDRAKYLPETREIELSAEATSPPLPDYRGGG
ncbi:MAG: hypothetical protein ACRDR6_18450 [Pseudonocardiaceae bacterium]